MWFVMEKLQDRISLAERLLYEIGAAGDDPTRTETRIRELVAAGADVNFRLESVLPLQAACIAGHWPTVQLLLNLGARVDLADGFRRMCLHYAAEQSSECVRVLLEAEADVNVLDLNGNTPLHLAAYRNKPDCVQQLLEAGADPCALNANRDSALSWAALRGNLEVMRLLLDYNCAPDTVNGGGNSPLRRLAQTLAIGLGSVQEEACLALLLKALGQFDLRDLRTNSLPSDLQNDEQMRGLLLAYSRNPRPLRELCRRAVRARLPVAHLKPRVHSLPLPSNLRQYVLLNN